MRSKAGQEQPLLAIHAARESAAYDRLFMTQNDNLTDDK